MDRKPFTGRPVPKRKKPSILALAWELHDKAQKAEKRAGKQEAAPVAVKKAAKKNCKKAKA